MNGRESRPKRSTPIPNSGRQSAAGSSQSNAPEFLLVRARTVLPIVNPPIEDAAVLVRNSTIAAVGKWSHLAKSAPTNTRKLDLGDVVLLPGLVNAHAHLDYTDMAGQLLPTKSFTDWIKLITEAKSGWTHEDFAQSWKNGAEMLLQTGTTTVVDIEAVPELLPSAWLQTPLRVLSLIELTGVRSRTQPEFLFNSAMHLVETLSSAGPGRVGLAPHAPYSTIPALLRLVAKTARLSRLPVAIHLAESTEEYEMFKFASGPMFEWLRRNQRDMSDCDGVTPVAHVERNGLLGPHTLTIHANCLEPEDINTLARRRVSVVHCPRSHKYFGHPPFQYHNLIRAGVNVCLGTDSLATVSHKRGQKAVLDLFAEMREFASEFPSTPPHEILRLCTTAAALAIHAGNRLGAIVTHAMADMIAIPYSGPPAKAEEAVITYEGSVSVSIIDGKFAIPPTHLT